MHNFWVKNHQSQWKSGLHPRPPRSTAFHLRPFVEALARTRRLLLGDEPEEDKEEEGPGRVPPGV